MVTVFEPSTNNNNELTEAKAQIKRLEEKVALLEKQLTENQRVIEDQAHEISCIEENMKREYVEGWKSHDGEFTGGMYWVKGEGVLRCDDGMYFDGQWNSAGVFTDGEVLDWHNNVLEKLVDGVNIEIGEEEKNEG